MQALIIVTLLGAILVAVFALQNAYYVTINFLVWQFEASLALVILVSVLAGAVLFGAFGVAKDARVKIYSWQQKRKKGKKEGLQDESEQDASENALMTNEMWQQESGLRRGTGEDRDNETNLEEQK